MKQSKTILLLTVIVAIILLGIAYAAIQDIKLSINATATAVPDQSNFKVEFIGDPIYIGDGEAIVEITGINTARISVSRLTAKGDTLIASFNIKNQSKDLIANLSKSVSYSNPEFFKVTSEVKDTSLDPKEITTVEIKVELIKTPISTNPKSDIEVKVIAKPSETP